MTTVPYVYRLDLVRIVDADTILFDADMGFKTKRRVMMRLLRINAPEKKGATKAAALASEEYLKGLIADRKLIGRTEKSDAFDRYLVELIAVDADGKETNVNDEMLASGHAVPFRE